MFDAWLESAESFQRRRGFVVVVVVIDFSYKTFLECPIGELGWRYRWPSFQYMEDSMTVRFPKILLVKFIYDSTLLRLPEVLIYSKCTFDNKNRVHWGHIVTDFDTKLVIHSTAIHLLHWNESYSWQPTNRLQHNHWVLFFSIGSHLHFKWN